MGIQLREKGAMRRTFFSVQQSSLREALRMMMIRIVVLVMVVVLLYRSTSPWLFALELSFLFRIIYLFFSLCRPHYQKKKAALSQQQQQQQQREELPATFVEEEGERGWAIFDFISAVEVVVASQRRREGEEVGARTFRDIIARNRSTIRTTQD